MLTFGTASGTAVTWSESAPPWKQLVAGTSCEGGEFTVYEGDWTPSRLVFLEFPSQEAWESFYYGSEYAEIKPDRDEVSTGRMVGVEGLAPGT